MKKCVYVVFALMLCLSLVGGTYVTADAATDVVVTFPDPNLEEAIREAIGKPTGDIYESDLQGLAQLDASDRDISDLTGLEYCVNLTHLHLYFNQISDISPLAGLTNLTAIDLSVNQISDISPLDSLTNLTDLNLYRNQISDISALANITSLTYLNLSHNQISDISALANLTGLTNLVLYDNHVSDISALDSLTNLTDLNLYRNQISDISALANITSLTYIDLSINQISDVSPLANLTSLTDLSLYYNQISDISPLANLTSLTRLRLSHNQVSDISSLANLTSLENLTLPHNQISDISPLANLTSLTQHHLDHNQISDVSPLANLTSLFDVNLDYNQVSDISPLANVTSLDYVRLKNNQVSDIQPLVDNDGLGQGNQVWLKGNPLSGVSVNTYIPQLQERGVSVSYDAEHALTIGVNGNGSTTPPVGYHTYPAATVVDITATPDSGWEFASWTGDVADPNSPTTTVTVTVDKTVTANFVDVEHELTIGVNGSGSTTPPAGSHTYTAGTVVNITATPSHGWEFASWTGDVADPNSPTTTVAVTVDKTVTANFVDVEHELTIGVNGSGSTTPPAGSHAYFTGTVVNITDTPGPGWQFVNWSGDVADPNSSSTTVTMTTDETVTANFEADLTPPDVTITSLSPNPAPIGEDIELRVLISDDESNVAGAEYFLNVIGDPGTGVPLEPEDGAWDSNEEEAVATIPALPFGVHVVYVRGVGVPGNWGRPAVAGVWVYDPDLWCLVQYEQSGYTTYSQVLNNMGPVDTNTVPAPSLAAWLYVSTAVEGGARELMLPGTAHLEPALVMVDYLPESNIWVTQHIVALEDAYGKLYVEDGVGDVDVSSTTDADGSHYTLGDGLPDPAGSAWLHLDNTIYTWIGFSEPDPLDPSTWGFLLYEAPYEVWRTTGHSYNHVVEPGELLYCYEKEGYGAPFYSGNLSWVSTYALLDLPSSENWPFLAQERDLQEVTVQDWLFVDTTALVISVVTPEPDGIYPVGTALEFSATDDPCSLSPRVIGHLNDGYQTIDVESGYVPGTGIYTLVVEATGLVGNTATSGPISFVVYDPDLWSLIPYEESGYKTVSSVTNNMGPVNTITIPVPPFAAWLYVSTAVEGGARELMLPATAPGGLGIVIVNHTPGSNYWATGHIVTEGAYGKLYVEDGVGDVDVSSTTDADGSNYTLGDGLPDPAGSAWLHEHGTTYTWIGFSEPDPLDPSTWGFLLYEEPVELWRTTGHCYNHVVEPGELLYCYEKEGYGAPFYSGNLSWVGTYALLDLPSVPEYPGPPTERDLQSVTVRDWLLVDTTPPEISVVTPEPYGIYTVGTALEFYPCSLSPRVIGHLNDGYQTIDVESGYIPEPGIYTLVVEATDLAGNTATSDPIFFVVYDPAGGFATGGGWFIPGKQGNSDPGDVLPGLDRTSKATFGFVVKYKKGATTTPSGQLEFQYHVGNFHLHSADYDWLVVTNQNWAKFQGVATINGSEELYPFRVDGRDGDKDRGSKPDRFIIKIWETGTDPDVDELIYKASGDLGGGQIKIHK